VNRSLYQLPPKYLKWRSHKQYFGAEGGEKQGRKNDLFLIPAFLSVIFLSAWPFEHTSNAKEVHLSCALGREGALPGQGRPLCMYNAERGN